MIGRRWVVVALALAALVAWPGAARAFAAEKPHYPVPYGPAARSAGQGGHVDVSPPGSNDWDCKPGRAHPNPVVLVHGLSANQTENWQTIAPLLANEGYCVFSLTYGRNPLAPPPLDQVGGLRPMEDSARELSGFVDRVRRATGAEKVDIVGHSEGSLMPNYYVKFLGGKRFVDRYVGMTPLWDGTQTAGLALVNNTATGLGLGPVADAGFAPVCGSCRQFLHGSEFLAKMSSGGGPAVPGVTYTMIMTRYDELVVPYTSGYLRAKNATNIVLQDRCPNDLAEHAAVAVDPVTAQHILNALDPSDRRPVDCFATSAQRSGRD
ncbi:lipase family alpha/beta hydrolase [Pseudonocardia acaciae]|uniref:lipase family alpha/beta hydrolase n=1 Tax=Pseudonocardia acaciae TaxID=551276 RepID=UPI00068655E4|nr:alpha/beta fold hydrolase [Pseudonocardia acaciae]